MIYIFQAFNQTLIHFLVAEYDVRSHTGIDHQSGVLSKIANVGACATQLKGEARQEEKGESRRGKEKREK